MALAWERKRPPHKWHGKQQEADAHDAGGAEIHKKFVLGQSHSIHQIVYTFGGKATTETSGETRQRTDAHDAGSHFPPKIAFVTMALAWERKWPPHKWHGKQQEADAHDAGGAEIHKKFVLGQSHSIHQIVYTFGGKATTETSGETRQRADAHDAGSHFPPEIAFVTMALAWERKRGHPTSGTESNKRLMLMMRAARKSTRSLFWANRTAFIKSSIPLEGKQLPRRVAKRDKGLMLMMLAHIFVTMALAWERKRPPHKWHGKQQEADAHDAGGAEIHKKFVLGQSHSIHQIVCTFGGKATTETSGETRQRADAHDAGSHFRHNGSGLGEKAATPQVARKATRG